MFPKKKTKQLSDDELLTSTHVKARNRGLFSTVRQRCVYDKSLVVLIDSEDTRERENV